MRLFYKLNILYILSSLVLISGCTPSSNLNQPVSAQVSPSILDKQSDIEILKGVADPCRQSAPDYDISPEKKDSPDFKLYELVNAGFPREISLDEAVTVFNRFAQCSETGKSQPPLKTEEVLAAIRVWVCERDADFEDKKIACRDFRKIADTGRMPKGSFLDYGGGATNYMGYDIDAWEINLYINLDKYRRDLKDSPVYSRLIRLNYISSKRTEE